MISHAAELGGAELALLRLIDALPPEYRSRVSVATLAEGPFPDELRWRGVDVVSVPLAGRTRALTRHDLMRPIPLARAVLDGASLVLRLTLAAGGDVRIVQSASMKSHLLGLPVALLSRRPLVWYLHDRLADDYLPAPVAHVLRVLSRLPRTVVVNSEATAATVPRATVVIYPGFSPEQALDDESVKSRPWQDPPVFTLLGRISPTKGQKEFVRAAAIVSRERPECRFRIVGSSMFGQEGYAGHVRLVAEQLKVPIEWVGFVDDPTVELDRATALVHASPTPEPFGQVVLEACVRGVPVIATDAGGVPEILGEEGLLVQPGDVDGLAAAMLRCLREPKETRDRARRAHRRAIERFSVVHSARQMVGVWRRLGAA